VPIIYDINIFTERVYKTRNYLIHDNPNIKDDVLFGVDRYWAMKTLLLLLQLISFRKKNVEQK
jgi:hypothetical protein